MGGDGSPSLKPTSVKNNINIYLSQNFTIFNFQYVLLPFHMCNLSNWSISVSESWSPYPNGILVGTTHQMGVYDECINVHQPVQGKYCIPLVTLKSTSGEDFAAGKPDDPQSYDPAWREILGVGITFASSHSKRNT